MCSDHVYTVSGKKKTYKKAQLSAGGDVSLIKYNIAYSISCHSSELAAQKIEHGLSTSNRHEKKAVGLFS